MVLLGTLTRSLQDPLPMARTASEVRAPKAIVVTQYFEEFNSHWKAGQAALGGENADCELQCPVVSPSHQPAYAS